MVLCRPERRSLWQLAGFVVAGGDYYGLGVEELAHSGGGEFAAVAGVLDAAEGEAGIGGDHGVEEDGTALKLGPVVRINCPVNTPGAVCAAVAESHSGDPSVS